MKKLAKFIMYLFVYVFVTLGTAVGVVFLSSPPQPEQEEGGNDVGGTPLSPQLSSILTNLTDKEAILAELDIDIQDGDNLYSVNLDALVDLSEGFNNLQVDGNLAVDLGDSIINVDIKYADSSVYFSLFNGNFRLDTKNLMGAVGTILSVLDIQMPGFDLEGLDLASFMGLLGNLSEEKGEEHITLTMSVPVIGKLTMVCDLDYGLKQIKIPTTKLGQYTTITFSTDISYPETVEIQKPVKENYINATSLIDVVAGTLNLLNQDNIGLDINLNYEEYELSGHFSADLKNLSSLLSLDVYGEELSIIAIDNVAYLDYKNIGLCFDLEDTSAITNLLSEQFGIEIPLDLITNLLASLKNGEFLEVAGSLGIGAGAVAFDSTAIDLSILQDIVKDGDRYSIVLRDIGTIGLTITDSKLNQLSFNGFGVNAIVDVVEPQTISLNKPQENYANLKAVIPTIDSLINTLKKKAFEADATIKVGQQLINANIALDFSQENISAQIISKLYEQDFKLTLFEQKVYIEAMGAKLSADMNDFAFVQSLLEKEFGLKLETNTEIDFNLILGALNTITSTENYPLLINKFEQNGNLLTIGLLDDITIEIESEEVITGVNIIYKDISVNLDLTSYNESLNIEQPIEEDYITISNLLSVAEGAFNFICQESFGMDITVKYNNQEFNADLFASVSEQSVIISTILDKALNLIILDEVVYIEYGNLNFSFAIEDYELVTSFLEEQFGIILPMDTINLALGILTSENILESLLSMDLDFDLNSLDLSMLSSIVKVGDKYSISIADIGNLDLVINDSEIKQVVFNSYGIDATVNMIAPKSITLDNDKENYLDLATVVPTVNSALNTIDYNNFTANAVVKIGAQTINAVLEVINNNFESVAIRANISAFDNQMTITFINNKLYIDLYGLHLVLDATDIDSIMALLETFGIVLDTQNEVDLNAVLETFSELTNPENPSIISSLTRVDDTLTITLMNDIIISITNGEIITGLTAKYNNIEVTLSSILASNDTLTISEPTGEYITGSELVSLAETLLDFASQGSFGFETVIKYNDKELNAHLTLDLTDFGAIISTTILDKTLNIVLLDEVAYIEYGNLNFYFDLKDINQVATLLETQFGIAIPVETINKVIEVLASENILASVKDLTKDFNNVSSIDLSMISSITKENDTFSISLANIGTITLNTAEKKLTQINFNGYDFNVTLTNVAPKAIALTNTKESYHNLSTIIPTVDSALNTIKHNKYFGNFSIIVNDYTITGSIDVYLDVNYNITAVIIANVKGFEPTIKLTLLNNQLYIEALGLMLVADMSDVETIKSFLSTNFGITLDSNISNINIVDTIKNITNPETYLSLISRLENIDNTLYLTLLNDIMLSISSDGTINGLSVVYGDINASISNISVSIVENFTYPNINTANYTDISEVISKAENIINFIKNRKFELSGKLNLPLLGFDQTFTLETLKVDLSDLNNIKAYAQVSFEGVSAIVRFDDNIIYLEVQGLKTYLPINNINELISWVSTRFGVEFDLSATENINFNLQNIINYLNLGTIKSDGKLTGLSINLNGLMIDINFGEILAINNINVIAGDITANLKMITNQNVSFETPSKEDYLEFNKITAFIDTVMDYIEPMQFNVVANANISTGNTTSIEANVTAELDLTNALEMYAGIEVSGDANIALTTHAHNKYFYVDYNGLAMKINSVDLQELIIIAGNLIGIDMTTFLPFLKDVANGMEDINFDNISGIIPDIDLSNPLALIAFAKNIALTESSLDLTIDASKLLGSNQDLVLSLNISNDKVTSMTITNFEINDNQSLNLVVNFADFTGVTTPSADKKYHDISGANELIKALINTAELDFYEIDGDLQIIGELIGVKIDWVVPINIKVKLDENRKPQIMAEMDVPVIGSNVPLFDGINVNNDVPYKSPDTSVKSRHLTIYYMDGFIYFYRHDVMNQTIFSTRTYEKKLKVSVDAVMEDLLYYVQYAFGFTDAILDAIKDSLALSKGHKPDLANIINYFKVTDSMNYEISLNMEELTNNPLMGSMALGLQVINNDQTGNKNYIGGATFGLHMPLASVFTLDLISNDSSKADKLSLVNIGKNLDADFAKLYNYVNTYTFPAEEARECSNGGNWTIASQTLYTVHYWENGGPDIDDMTIAPSTTFSLPSFEPMIVEINGRKATKTFAGWYESETFEENTRFTGSTMPRRDLVLYAKWNVAYHYTIDFVTNSTNTLSSITQVEGSVLSLPTLTVKQENEGNVTTTSEFAGWYTDENYKTAFTNTTMPSEDITLYAKWNVVKVEETYQFKLYDQDEELYSFYIKADDEIDLSSVEKVNSKTLLYYDKAFNSQYTDALVMPYNDLTLYVRNYYSFSIYSQYGNTISQSYEVLQGSVISIPAQQYHEVDDGTQTQRDYYTFNGYKVNGTIQSLGTSYTMPNSNVAIEADWTKTTKLYYTITFDLGLHYNPQSCVAGCHYKKAPTAIAPVKVLDGETFKITDAYMPTCEIWSTAISWGVSYSYKATTWGTSKKDNGNGQTSFTITGNTTLYPYWKKQ